MGVGGRANGLTLEILAMAHMRNENVLLNMHANLVDEKLDAY